MGEREGVRGRRGEGRAVGVGDGRGKESEPLVTTHVTSPNPACKILENCDCAGCAFAAGQAPSVAGTAFFNFKKGSAGSSDFAFRLELPHKVRGSVDGSAWFRVMVVAFRTKLPTVPEWFRVVPVHGASAPCKFVSRREREIATGPRRRAMLYPDASARWPRGLGAVQFCISARARDGHGGSAPCNVVSRREREMAAGPRRRGILYLNASARSPELRYLPGVLQEASPCGQALPGGQRADSVDAAAHACGDRLQGRNDEVLM